MARRLPPLNPLRAFEATARLGSLSRAAAELNVTHGAVSHQLAALEQSLAVPLFERHGRRLKLTPGGAELLPAVSTAFEGIAAATARMTRPASSGALAVSCVPALLSFWLIPRLGGFFQQYPGIDLTLSASNDPDDLRSADVDICILYGDGSWKDCWLKRWSGLELFPSRALRWSAGGRSVPSATSPTTSSCTPTTGGNGTHGWLPPTHWTCGRPASTT